MGSGAPKDLVNWIAVITASAFSFVGCRTGEQGPRARIDAPAASSKSELSIAHPPGQRNEVEVIYCMEPRHFSFRVGDHEVGTDRKLLVEYLKAHGVTGIRFSSEYKMTNEAVQEFVTLFDSEGIRTLEFWVPLGTRPGRIDLMKVP